MTSERLPEQNGGPLAQLEREGEVQMPSVLNGETEYAAQFVFQGDMSSRCMFVIIEAQMVLSS